MKKIIAITKKIIVLIRLRYLGSANQGVGLSVFFSELLAEGTLRLILDIKFFY